MDPQFQPLFLLGLVLSIFLLALLLRLLWVMLRRRRSGMEPPPARNLLVEALREQTKREQEAVRDRRETVLALESLSATHAAVMTHLPVGVLVLDAQHRLTFANPAAMRLLDLDAVTRQDLSAIDDALAGWFNLGTASGEITFDHSAGSRFLDISRVALEHGDTLLTLSDRTMERQLEQQLRYKRDVAVMGELAGGIAHEVKNALAVIQGRIQMLLRGDVAAHAEKMRAEIDRLLAVLREFMRGRSEAFTPQSVDLADVLGHLADRWHDLPDGDKVKLEVPPARTWVLQADPDQLQEALHNLITNGVEACREAGISAHPWVQLRLTPTTDGPRLIVCDAGPGIPANMKPKLFVPFISSKDKGNGLGLFHARRILMQHGAELRLLDDEQTCFAIQFQTGAPAHQPAEPPS